MINFILNRNPNENTLGYLLPAANSTAICIKRGVGQGRNLFFLYFITFIPKLSVRGVEERIIVNGEIINYLSYADGTVLLISSRLDWHILSSCPLKQSIHLFFPCGSWPFMFDAITHLNMDSSLDLETCLYQLLSIFSALGLRQESGTWPSRERSSVDKGTLVS